MLVDSKAILAADKGLFYPKIGLSFICAILHKIVKIPSAKTNRFPVATLKQFAPLIFTVSQLWHSGFGEFSLIFSKKFLLKTVY
ncbi:hypothetical protein TPSD3_13500 [Thioflexithrix psekupsensis]|uniref:Uncharacterized protein n=1 Tax=Thioflexithrix psekupsensis TaxID=1570016 RepID=A0A251X4W2_9GAMM|nr:hypothetical protein TPSD3_13500 [Thioflexithrix psekupsensis]